METKEKAFEQTLKNLELRKAQGREFLLQTASMIITIITAVIGLTFVVGRMGENEIIKNILPVGTTTPVVVEPSQYPDYDNLNSLTAVKLISATTSSQNLRPIKPISISLEMKGGFSRIYLYTEASVNDKPLTDWDSLYVGFRTHLYPLEEMGHLFRPNSLPTPQDNKSTRLLFNTSVTPYTYLPYSSSRTPTLVNLFEKFFNLTDQPIKTYLDTYISTTQKGAIHLIALYYSCAAETPDCYIKVTE